MMTDGYLIGLDFGTESARGVLVSIASGRQERSLVCRYKHGVMTSRLESGVDLPPAYALQDADDYLLAAEIILRELGSGRRIEAIGLDSTASSPLPALADGTPLSRIAPSEPHAYVKLWKHAAAQSYAEAINQRGGAYLANFGGRLSGEWLLAKAAQLRAEAPDIWNRTDRFIEAGDWVVWQLTGREVRSLNLAAYKAQYLPAAGYPEHVVPGLADRLSAPHQVGTAAGELTADWRRRTGITGRAVVAVAAIDSHAVVPAVKAGRSRTLIGALGTSAAYLYLTNHPQPLPRGLEGAAENAALPGFWGYEAGQPAFGDILAWFARAFPLAADEGATFDLYNSAAAAIRPGSTQLLAIDWWSGNRVPFADTSLSGMLIGLNLATTGAAIYRALVEGLCFGARSIIDVLAAGNLPTEHLIATSGLAQRNPLVVQTLADVTGLTVEVPSIANATSVGAAIHGAVAAGVVDDFAAGQRKFGATSSQSYQPDNKVRPIYDEIYARYRAITADNVIRDTMRSLKDVAVRTYADERAGTTEQTATQAAAGASG
jgi:L-ribulokinase